MGTNKTWMALVLLGAGAAIAGFVTSVIYLLQPWRTCPYDDSAAACAMLPADADVLKLAVIVMVVGACVCLSAAVFVRRA